MYRKKFIYILTFIFICLITTFYGENYSQSLSFLETQNNQQIISLDNPQKSSNWQEIILKMEKKSTSNYESFFGQNFTDKIDTAQQIASNLKQVQQKIGKNPAAIWIWSNKDKLDIIMTTSKNKPVGKSINQANQKKLNEVTREFIDKIANPMSVNMNNSTSYLSSAQQLYQWMIAPFESQLQAEKIDTLIICVNSGLRTLPFAALHDGKKFLIEKYSISIVPSFALTDISVSQKNDQQIQVLAMGSSTFENQNLSSLPGVPLELNNITPSPWQGIKITEENFTVNNLKNEREKKPFDIIHLATHAQFQSGTPSNSYIQFTREKLTLDQLNALHWDNPPVELLVLSACQTAIGDKDAELGFAGLAVQSGVKSAMGSYWSVSDAGTLGLMSEFYQNLKSYYNKYNILFKADALRDTQISMINNKVYLEKGQLRTTRGSLSLPSELTQSGEDSLSHPFYWSAFTIIGSPW